MCVSENTARHCCPGHSYLCKMSGAFLTRVGRRWISAAHTSPASPLDAQKNPVPGTAHPSVGGCGRGVAADHTPARDPGGGALGLGPTLQEGGGSK